MEFAHAFPAEFKDWHTKSNSIINLSVKTEKTLWDFCDLLTEKGLPFIRFFEPDIGHSLTAIAIVPGPAVKKVCSGIPLAGKHNTFNNGGSEQVKLDRLTATKELVYDMQECYQSKGLNMLDHGLAVRDRLFDLLQTARHPEQPSKFQWRYPTWFFQYAPKIAYNLRSDFVLDRYTIWHDCGKPACKAPSEGSNGDVRWSYPDHAKVSADAFGSISDLGLEENRIIQELIRRDMDIHTLKTEGVEEFCQTGTKEDALSLLLTGLAEVHANAEMFGGMQSDSFKIKFKQLEKKGTLICKFLLEEQEK